MFVLNSDITIGTYKRVKPHEVKITKSMFEYVDKAILKLPITARIKQAGEIVTETIETAKAFNEGDKVIIQLGYNGSLKTEFEGYISRVNFTSPLEVECEGYSYQLRKKTYLHTFKSVELLQVLKYLVSGTDIKLDEKLIPSFKIEKLVLQNHSGTEALEMIKKISDNTIRLFFTGNLLYAGLQYLKPKADVKYKMGWNVIKDGNLKLRQAKNQDVIVHYIGEKKDGTKVKVKVGNHVRTASANVAVASGAAGTTGETKVIKTHAVIDESSLKQMANAKLTSLSYDGYEGKITAFGIPYCEPGYRAVLNDEKYPERSGNYIVESMEVLYGMRGFRRTVGIGAKL
jgi:hypothetical protein